MLIGIQARTNSTRFPGKCNLPVGTRTVLERVADACTEAAQFINRNMPKLGAVVRVAILCPNGDDIERRYGSRYLVMSFPGLAEDDVLSRYYIAAEKMRADYVVRITADCVFTAPYLVSRCIKAALLGGHDYVTNTHHRSFREGMDTEVISAGLLAWLHSQAVDSEREHVTTLLAERHLVPSAYRYCHVLNDVDDSALKTSIDTPEDYDRALVELQQLQTKRVAALQQGDTVA